MGEFDWILGGRIGADFMQSTETEERTARIPAISWSDLFDGMIYRERRYVYAGRLEGKKRISWSFYLLEGSRLKIQYLVDFILSELSSYLTFAAMHTIF